MHMGRLHAVLAAFSAVLIAANVAGEEIKPDRANHSDGEA